MTKAIIFKDQQEANEFQFKDNNSHTVMIRPCDDDNTQLKIKGLEMLRTTLTSAASTAFYLEAIKDENEEWIYREEFGCNCMKIEYKDGRFVFGEGGDKLAYFPDWEGFGFSTFPHIRFNGNTDYIDAGFVNIPKGYSVVTVYDQSGNGNHATTAPPKKLTDEELFQEWKKSKNLTWDEWIEYGETIQAFNDYAEYYHQATLKNLKQ